MSLWFMAFGGTVALGNLAFGPIVDAVGARAVMYFGVAAAVVLAWWCDVSRRSVVFLEDDPPSAAASSAAGDRRRDPVETGGAAGLDEHGVTAGE